MTVCIAAISEQLRAIVTVSDLLLSDDFSSTKSLRPKVTWLLARRWNCLYSGNPTVFRHLTRRIAADLKSNSASTYQDVMEAVERAYDAVLEHSIERQILAPLGMTRKEFIDSGATKLGENLFRELETEIRSVNLATELLVFGFDEQHEPHIFSSDFVGRCTLYDDVGFHAIGVGSWAALGWLFTNKRFVQSRSIAEIAYRLCEAKFAAETARSVGGDTALLVMFNDGDVAPMYIYGPPVSVSTNVIREAWEARRNQPIPPEVTSEIERTLTHYMTRSGVSKLLSLPSSDRKQTEDPGPTKPS